MPKAWNGAYPKGGAGQSHDRRDRARSGSLDVTVSQIAKRAGMSPALAHHYFGSKEEMFLSAMRHILTLYGAEVRGALAGARPRRPGAGHSGGQLQPGNFRREAVGAWLNFWVLAQTVPRPSGCWRSIRGGCGRVIVGSGSAGSAMAYRLSEDGKHTVIVIEYGGSDAGPFIQMPGAVLSDEHERSTTGASRPSPSRISAAAVGHAARQGDRRLVLHQRHGLCARPCRDFDTWAEMGAPAGPMPTCCPISSAWRTPRRARRAGAAPTARCTSARPAPNPLYQRLHRGGPQAGFETTDDYNGSKQEGFGRWSRPSTRAAAGRRQRLSAAGAEAGNVNSSAVLCPRVVIENRRAVGVEIERSAARSKSLRQTAR
jgi:hypothetical protein